jgi:hypothetical protein
MTEQNRKSRFGCLLNVLLAVVALGAVGYVLWEKYQQRQQAAEPAMNHGVSAGRALSAGDPQDALYALREAADEFDAAGKEKLSAIFRDAAAFVDGAQPGASSGLSRFPVGDSCRELLVKEDTGRIQAVYEHPYGVINLLLVDFPDETSDKPLIERAGDGWVVGWSKRIGGQTYYVWGMMTTQQAADEVAGWFSQPERLPGADFRIVERFKPPAPRYAISNPLRNPSIPMPGAPEPGGAGAGGVKTTARELARFGLLYLNRGTWNGRQFLSVSYVDQATTYQVPAVVRRVLPPVGSGGGWA